MKPNVSQRRFPGAATPNRGVASDNKEESMPRPPMAIQRLSPSKLQQKRDKGLCYNCNEKFHPGHWCKKLFFIEACYNEEDGDVVMDVESFEAQEGKEMPGISLHAISGTQTSDTMRVRSSIGSIATIALLDSRSTHNFLSEHLASRLDLQPTNSKKVQVIVASGDKFSSKGKCIGVQLKLGSFLTCAYFYILPLGGYDIVMGTKWLRTLGEIWWDFSKLVMQFTVAGREITL